MADLLPAGAVYEGPAQASTDDQLVELWLHGRPANTERAYRREFATFRAVVGRPLRAVRLADAQAYADSLSHLAPATRARSINAVRSLFRFAQRVGYLSFNVAAAIQPPKIKDVLAERILDEPAVQKILALETDRRNHVILRLLYGSGLRVSELSALTWRDTSTRGDAGQITVFGKGGKTRAVLLSPATWAELVGLRASDDPDGAVFRSQRTGGHLDVSQLRRIVLKAAERAGISAHVSPHWLRHAHASHALDRGAPIHLVQQTLGHASVATTGRYLHARPNDSSARYLPV